MPEHSAAHLWTALAYYIIGAVLLITGLRLLHTHPINRAFLLGPYLTEAGVRLVMRHWWLVLAFAAFILSCAFEHHADWLVHQGSPWVTRAQVAFLAEIEAIVSMLTALLVLWLRVKAWLR